uniref:Uncharacterized protein n=1 Tax=Ciona intestinalis TaxID=7719 RepID=H2XWV1_CIOIN
MKIKLIKNEEKGIKRNRPKKLIETITRKGISLTAIYLYSTHLQYLHF